MPVLSIVVPLFNDWISFVTLVTKLDEFAATCPYKVCILGIDDGSSEPVEPFLGAVPDFASLESLEIVHLAINVGHQRAIATGLCVVVDDAASDAIVVMDGDGEDPPAAIASLLAAASNPGRFYVVAQRRRRTENLTFRLSYVVYKVMFSLVTGKKINFGNFSAMSMSNAQRLVLVSELWNNLPAAVLRSRIPISFCPVDRGYRYAGRSKMNFVSLIVHGMSGISVYADAIFVRLLVFAILLAVSTGAAICALLVLRLFFPTHATPGWATTVSFGMLIILFQVGFTALSSSLILLNGRVQREILPIHDYKPYVSMRRQVFKRS
ncbi:glycosyltransferase [Granulicella paludicola]|uniref:glycosyltransferase n=1 Tax=Granulicella paludicola TaxID=474951 RepID=UPI0021DFDB31|nr:glycosyltransferase [Granulicella paludicola]